MQNRKLTVAMQVLTFYHFVPGDDFLWVSIIPMGVLRIVTSVEGMVFDY